MLRDYDKDSLLAWGNSQKLWTLTISHSLLHVMPKVTTIPRKDRNMFHTKSSFCCILLSDSEAFDWFGAGGAGNAGCLHPSPRNGRLCKAWQAFLCYASVPALLAEGGITRLPRRYIADNKWKVRYKGCSRVNSDAHKIPQAALRKHQKTSSFRKHGIHNPSRSENKSSVGNNGLIGFPGT